MRRRVDFVTGACLLAENRRSFHAASIRYNKFRCLAGTSTCNDATYPSPLMLYVNFQGLGLPTGSMVLVAPRLRANLEVSRWSTSMRMKCLMCRYFRCRSRCIYQRILCLLGGLLVDAVWACKSIERLVNSILYIQVFPFSGMRT